MREFRTPSVRRWAVLRASMAVSAVASTVATAAPQNHDIAIEGMRFKPETLAVHRGDRIVWHNKDLVPHTATAASGVFDSHTIAAGASWTWVASMPGTVPYVCTMHPTMKGTLTVE